MLAKDMKYKYIDVDEIGHKVYEYPEILEKAYALFGTEINDKSGQFDRKKLGQIVFNERNTSRVKEFSDLTWEHMQRVLDREITDNSVVDWILLPHTKYWQKNAIKVLIKAKDDELRINGLIKRDNITSEYVKLRDKASIDYNESEFNFVFVNDYKKKKLKQHVSCLINYINSIKS